ncbi:AraC family transcriptional regulator [Clostridium botulinum]|nr:AraC family transcriptional regulator [Clostridium botulinum]EPS46714.1 two-component response regulator [Clostridium botulinum A1 str. CFSAN002368]
MERAKELLLNTDDYVGSIAIEVSYKEATYFASQFRK